MLKTTYNPQALKNKDKRTKIGSISIWLPVGECVWLGLKINWKKADDM